MPRSRKKPSTPLSLAKNKLRSAADKRTALNALRNTGDISLLAPIAAWSSGWLQALGVIGSTAPRRLNALNVSTWLGPTSLARELEWAVGVLLGHIVHLQKYLSIKSEFERAVLTQDAVAIFEILDRAERELGFSHQFLSARIALLHLENGLEAQKAFVTALRSSGSPMVNFMTFWWSVRAEDSSTANYYIDTMNRNLAEWQISSELRAQIRYYTLNEIPADGLEATLLSISSSGSVIDTYEAIIALATSAASERRTSMALFRSAVERLGGQFGDPRLSKILLLFNDPTAFEKLELVPVANRRALLEGTSRAFEADVALGPNELWAASQVEKKLTGKSNTADRLIQTLTAVDLVGDEGARAGAALAKLGLMLGHLSVGRWASAMAEVYAPRARPFDPAHDGPRFVAASDALLEAFSVLSEEGRSTYAEALQKSYIATGLASAALVLAGVGGSESMAGLEIKQRAKHTLWRAVLVGDPESIRKASFDSLAISKDREAVYFSEASMLDLTMDEAALKSSVALLTEDASYSTWIPLERLVTRVYSGDTNHFPQLLETPLLFDFYSKFVDADFASFRSYVAEDFVRSHDVDRPSLLKFSERESELYARRFLADVCVPATLRLFVSFATERELEDERIAICRSLATTDPQNREQYEDEARSIVTARLVKEALKELQASKISIDEDALRAWAEKNLKEDYTRYQTFCATGLVAVDAAYKEALTKALQTGEIPRSLYDLPQNEASALFTDLVTRFIRACAADPEHGLDCYLSLRIRHGTMSGLLRSAAEREHVVTRRQTESGDYLPNAFWRDATASQLSPEQWTAIEERLTRFSQDIDALIAEITSEYVQIHRAEKPRGLFRVTLNALTVYSLATEVDETTPLDTFSRKCIDVFWAVVDRQLAELRVVLDTTIRDRFRSLYTILAANVREQGAAALADAVLRARTDADTGIDQVRDWFELPTPSPGLTFTMDELLAVGLEAIKSFHGDFEPTVKSSASELPPMVGALHLFADIFFIIFENIYKHSGSLSPEITVSSKIHDDMIVTRVENTLSEDRYGQEFADRVEQSRTRLMAGTYLSDVSREGGTGLPKLAKLVRYSQRADALDFGLDRVRKVFWLEFRVGAQVISRDEPG